MNTTVAVKPETLNLLKHIKDEMNAATFDETIRKIIVHVKKPQKSFFGALKGNKELFVREKSDRFD